MKINQNWLETPYSFNKIPHHISWDNATQKELGMHKIHMYPAKFPSFLISKSLEYARRKKIEINTIGDIFCGCGTTALEAKRNNKNFWGCDINPVATLIAKVKSERFDDKLLQKYYDVILETYKLSNFKTPKSYLLNERINYWFHLSQINKLYKLLRIIKSHIPAGMYQDFFLVAFSNILKGSSKWLTKSIKPQIDKTKKRNNIIEAFEKQFKTMLKAVCEIIVEKNTNAQTNIITENFLNYSIESPSVDMLITSPPYVTSYEYADLHQLSTLWLGYTKDFRTLREGTIGSVYHKTIEQIDIDQLNTIGKSIYDEIKKTKSSKAKSVAKYFIDMKNTVDKTYSLVTSGGLAVFVIGNTKYNGVYVDNAKYLTKCLIERGFTDIDIYKRRISSKILSPYRNKNGKFSNDKRKRKVYSYEFVIISKK
jgi:DNA modification methylase